MLTGELYAELEEERNERRAMLEMRNEDNAQNYQEEEIKTREIGTETTEGIRTGRYRGMSSGEDGDLEIGGGRGMNSRYYGDLRIGGGRAMSLGEEGDLESDSGKGASSREEGYLASGSGRSASSRVKNFRDSD